MGDNKRPKKKKEKKKLSRTLAATNPVIWGTYTENEEKLLVNTCTEMEVYLQRTFFFCLPLCKLELEVVMLDTSVDLCADALISSNRSISRLVKGEPSLSMVELDSTDPQSSSIPGSVRDSNFLNPLFIIDNSSGSRTPKH